VVVWAAAAAVQRTTRRSKAFMAGLRRKQEVVGWSSLILLPTFDVDEHAAPRGLCAAIA
jgi:hypothetical protein